jgi:hypothetical protein
MAPRVRGQERRRATEKVPAVAVAIGPTRGISGHLEGLAGQDPAHGMVTVRSSASTRVWLARLGGRWTRRRRRPSSGYEGGREVGLELDGGVEAARSENVLVLSAHVPAAVGTVGGGFWPGRWPPPIGRWKARGRRRSAYLEEQGRQHPMAIELVEQWCSPTGLTRAFSTLVRGKPDTWGPMVPPPRRDRGPGAAADPLWGVTHSGGTRCP